MDHDSAVNGVSTFFVGRMRERDEKEMAKRTTRELFRTSAFFLLESLPPRRPAAAMVDALTLQAARDHYLVLSAWSAVESKSSLTLDETST